MVRRGGKGKNMASRVGSCAAALAAALSLAGCAGAARPNAACRCPEPVHYSDAQIKAISAALRALPDNNPLQQAMSDYEDERDNLRICLGR